MTLVVVSDSHGDVRRLEQMRDRQLRLPEDRRPEVLLHLGDGSADLDRVAWPPSFSVFGVRGNCDGFLSSEMLSERLLCLGGYRILMLHGHHFSVKAGLDRVIAYAAQKEADLLLFGHTHEPTAFALPIGYEVVDRILAKPLSVFNPGSLREGSFGVIGLLPTGIFMSHGRLERLE